jgi:hypothetical protein
MVAHELSPRVPAPARLRALVSSLRGRLAVTNHPRAVRLPNGLATAVRALIRAGFDESVLTTSAVGTAGRHSPAYDRPPLEADRDPRAAFARRMVQGLLATVPSTVRRELSRGVTWVALALYESDAPTVRLDPSPATDAGPRSVIATIDVDYRFVIAAGSVTPCDWQSLDATAVSAPASGWPPRRPSTTRRWRGNPAGRTATVVPDSSPRSGPVARRPCRRRDARRLGAPNGTLWRARPLLVPGDMGPLPRAGTSHRLAHGE